MRQYGQFLLILLLLALAAPASAQVNLRWRLKKGQTFYVEEKGQFSQIVKIDDRIYRPAMDQTRVSRFTILQAAPDGGAVIEQKIESVQVTSKGAGVKPTADVLRNFEGAGFRITLDGRQRITKFEGFKALADKIARDNPHAAELMRELVSKENLQEPVALQFAFTPEKPVSKGDQWQIKSTLPFANLARMHLTDTYLFEGAQKGAKEVVRVGIKTAIMSSTPKGAEGLPFKVIRSKVEVKESRGHLLFNVAAGRLVRREMKLTLHGIFTLSFGNQPINMELEQQQTTTTRVLDHNPLKK
jgi:hypothetical protein